MKLTARQAAVVGARGGDLLVAASAGAGKTEVLTRRCVELLADAQRPARIDRFLIVTFTRAAASELRVRLANMLTATAETTADRLVRRHLRQQAALLDCAQIGTIDAFCQRLVRTEYIAAGVDPAFGVLDPAEASLLRTTVRGDLLEWVYQANDPVAAGARVWIEAQRRPDDSSLGDLLEQMNRWREQRLDPASWFAACRARADLSPRDLGADAQRRLTESLSAEFAAQLAALAGAEADVAVGQYVHQLDEWHRAMADPANFEAVIAAMGAYRLPRGDSPLFATVKKRWWEARLKKAWSAEQVSLWFESLPHAARSLRMLLDLEARYDAALRAAKERRRAYEFADVQRLALNLLYDGSASLGRPSALALRLRGQYDHVLIDESQDTNAVQLALFEAVGRTGEAGNRFLVGDVKQSIYGFRGAEPRLFAELAQAFRTGRRPGRVLPLTDNFRSHPRVLSALNACFARLFTCEFGGVDFTHDEELTAGRAELPNPGLDATPRVFIELIEEAANGRGPTDEADAASGPNAEDELERVEREAWRIATHIRELRDRRVPVLERGPDGAPRLRPFRFSDVAVLLRTARFKAGQVTRVLRSAGLPCVASGRESLLDVLEVQDLLGVLRLLVHERQDIALTAYLRGPYVGMEDAALLAIRRSSPDADWRDAVGRYVAQGEDASLRDRLRAALAQLEHWRTRARILSVTSLIGEILADAGGECVALAQPDGAVRAASLHALAELAGQHPSHGLPEFLAWIEAREAEDNPAPAPSVDAGDAIRVMTIHASKGLEFPFVFLLDAGTRFNNAGQTGMLLLDEQAGAGLRYFDRPARARRVDPVHSLASAARARRDREEELRLLYVATTRAREKLVIVGHSTAEKWEVAKERFSPGQRLSLLERADANCMLDWLLPAAAGNREVHVAMVPLDEVRVEKQGRIGSAPQSVALPPEDVAWVEAAAARLARTAAPVAPAPPAVMSVSVLKKSAEAPTFGGRESAGRRNSGFDAGRLEAPAFLSPPTLDGRTIGSATHRFLQHADFARLAAGEVDEELRRCIAAGSLTAEEAGLIDRPSLAWFGASDVCRRLATAPPNRVHRELPFVFGVRLAGPAHPPTILRGVIDVLIRADDGLRLFDYKTDVFASPEVRSARLRDYETQLRLYATVAARLFDQPVGEAKLVLLAAREIHACDPTPLDVAARFASLGAVAVAAGASAAAEATD